MLLRGRPTARFAVGWVEAAPNGQVVIYSSSTSNIVEFDMPAYPGLYLSFSMHYPRP